MHVCVKHFHISTEKKKQLHKIPELARTLFTTIIMCQERRHNYFFVTSTLLGI